MSPRPLAGDRLRRVLALVPWVLEHPDTTLSELARRFEVSERDLERDLELLPLCGLPPYTADRLIDVWVGDDGAVSIRLAEYFDRPLRLTPGEGVALLAAGRALLAVPGSDEHGALARALDKLETAVGARGGVSVEVGGATHLATFQAAAEAHECVEVRYYSFARDVETTRVIEPERVFHAFGSWYVAAWCRLAAGERLFRIDRVRAARATGEHFEPRARPGDGGGELGDLVYRPDPSDPRVTLRLAPEAAWVVENLPQDSARPLAGGGYEVVLAVSGPAFLERLLLQLGPLATVVEPPEAAESARAAARRILARYR
ncbi:MAG TPA: WYL domain-containing protein [Acidimicrobiia bacterium]|nr:WYL domain-containing protein [Acidimicrobiia bacterium]